MNTLNPYLSPWYFTQNDPHLTHEASSLTWDHLKKINDEYIGINTLMNDKNECLGLVNTYVYILPTNDGSKFLIWKRQDHNQNPIKTLNFAIYQTEDLKPITNHEQKARELNQNNINYHFNTPPIATAE